jgi:outer membrane protein TolC
MINPTYTKPTVDTPNGWANFTETMPNESNFIYTAWWQKFNDPVLNQLIESGLLVNNTVQKAYGNLEMAQGQLKAVELSWIPVLNLYAGYSTNPALAIPNYFYGAWPAYASFNIFSTLSQQRAAKIGVEAQEYAVQSAKLVFIGQVANSYYTYIAEIERLKLLDQYIDDLQQMYSIQQSNYNDGISADQEVDALNQRVLEIKAQQKVIQTNILKAQNALRYLINQNPGSIPTRADFAKLNTQYPDLGTQPVTVLANRPDVSFAEAQFKLATQNVGVAASQLLPAVQLDYFGGQSDVGTTGLPNGFYTPTTDAYLYWSVNPAVFGQISALKGAKKVAYVNYIDTVRKALHDVDNDLLNHRDANDRYVLIYKAYLAASDKYQLNNALYKRGIISYNDTLNDKLNQDQAAIALNQIKLTQMTTLVNLYQDLGGGYKYNESQPVVTK